MVAINLNLPCIDYDDDGYNELVTRCIPAERTPLLPVRMSTMHDMSTGRSRSDNRPLRTSGVMQTRDARTTSTFDVHLYL